MPHPAAVLRFISPTKATRLCCDYDTPYGQFIKELFEFAWESPNINAAVVLPTPTKPTCVTLRYVDNRPDASLGDITALGRCKQDTELVRQLHFTHRGQDVEVCRWLRYMKTSYGWESTTGWLSFGFRFFSYPAALADTILDYKCFLAAATPEESMWQPPPETRPVDYFEFRTAKKA